MPRSKGRSAQLMATRGGIRDKNEMFRNSSDGEAWRRVEGGGETG